MKKLSKTEHRSVVLNIEDCVNAISMISLRLDNFKEKLNKEEDVDLSACRIDILACIREETFLARELFYLRERIQKLENL